MSVISLQINSKCTLREVKVVLASSVLHHQLPEDLNLVKTFLAPWWHWTVLQMFGGSSWLGFDLLFLPASAVAERHIQGVQSIDLITIMRKVMVKIMRKMTIERLGPHSHQETGLAHSTSLFCGPQQNCILLVNINYDHLFGTNYPNKSLNFTTQIWHSSINILGQRPVWPGLQIWPWQPLQSQGVLPGRK